MGSLFSKAHCRLTQFWQSDFNVAIGSVRPLLRRFAGRSSWAAAVLFRDLKHPSESMERPCNRRTLCSAHPERQNRSSLSKLRFEWLERTLMMLLLLYIDQWISVRDESITSLSSASIKQFAADFKGRRENYDNEYAFLLSRNGQCSSPWKYRNTIAEPNCLRRI
jgi:hypothetical protein